MALNYNFPRVDVTTTALQRKNLSPVTEDTLVLFAPFKGSYGPINEVVICHSYADFTASFGELDYNINGQNGIQIKNWLDNGGTVYAVRVEVTDEKLPFESQIVPAKTAEGLISAMGVIYPILNMGERHFSLVENSENPAVNSISIKPFTRITEYKTVDDPLDIEFGISRTFNTEGGYSDTVMCYRTGTVNVFIPTVPITYVCYCPERYDYPEGVKTKMSEWFTVGYAKTNMYDTYSETISTGAYANAKLLDFSFPLRYLISGVYIFNPINKKTAYVKISQGNNSTVFHYEIIDENGNTKTQNIVSWDYDDDVLYLTRDITQSSANAYISTSLPDKFIISGDRMKDDTGYFSLLEAFKGSIQLTNNNNKRITGMLPIGTMLSYSHFETTGDETTPLQVMISLPTNKHFDNSMFGNFYSDFTYIYKYSDSIIDDLLSNVTFDTRPMFKRISGGKVQLVYNVGNAYKYLAASKMDIDDALRNYFILYHGDDEVKKDNRPFYAWNDGEMSYDCEIDGHIRPLSLLNDRVRFASEFILNKNLYEFDEALNIIKYNIPEGYKHRLLGSEHYSYTDDIMIGYDDNKGKTHVLDGLVSLISKAIGSKYNDLSVSIKMVTNDQYLITTYLGKQPVQMSYLNKNDTYKIFEKDNDIFEYLYFDIGYVNEAAYSREDLNSVGEIILNYIISKTSSNPEDPYAKIKLEGGRDSSASQDELVKLYFADDAFKADRAKIVDKLKYPIDVFLDAGYSLNTKTAIYEAFCSDEYNPKHIRNDVFVYMDLFDSNGTSLERDVLSLPETINTRNLALYTQRFNIKYADKQMWVTPNYFISKLLPRNAVLNNRGVHEPIAGLNRAVLNLNDTIVKVNESLLPERKQELFDSRINYADRTATQIFFANQRTRERAADNTALQFINNSLTTNRLVKDVERLCRQYLFEYNDSITISNLTKQVNKYLETYIERRALAYAVVEISKSPYSEEQLDVTLNIKYNGTVEVISIDLTIL